MSPFLQESVLGQMFQPFCASSIDRGAPAVSCCCLITKACSAHRTSENALTRRVRDKSLQAWAHVCRVGVRRWWRPCSRGMQCHHGSAGRMCRGVCCAKLGVCMRREPMVGPVLEECLVLCTTGAAAENSPKKVGSPRWRDAVHLQ
ncbi:uncharacterized protein LOC144168945 isoform X1 [Haemaphysalis longicornis]